MLNNNTPTRKGRGSLHTFNLHTMQSLKIEVLDDIKTLAILDEITLDIPGLETGASTTVRPFSEHGR